MFKPGAIFKQFEIKCLNRILISRCYATHWDPKFKKIRRDKIVEMKFPDFEKVKKNNMFKMTAEEKRSHAIKEGIDPPISFEYKPINITTSNEIFDPYIPPEGDGKLINLKNISQKLEQSKQFLNKKFRTSNAIKKYEESFSEIQFAETAQQIYIDAHKALMNRDNEKLLEYVTEHGYSKMWLNMKFKTIKWEWLESIEQPTVAHMVTRPMIKKDNIYAQVTVRLHSKQILSVFDRFGRLAFGSDKIVKDVLEYVVYERHLTNIYSSWRMHDKIEPSWAPPKTPIRRSYVQPKLFKVDESLPDKDISKFKKDDESHLVEEESSPKPALTS